MTCFHSGRRIPHWALPWGRFPPFDATIEVSMTPAKPALKWVAIDCNCTSDIGSTFAPGLWLWGCVPPDRKSGYLTEMKAGIDFIHHNAIDRTNGGMATTQNLSNDTWGPAPELRTPQQLAYGLLGMSFYFTII
jgi:hypothetical protein